MWCPKHRWEFTNPSFTVCPACGTALVDALPSGEALVGSTPADLPPMDDTVTATRLGSFERLAAPMLLDLLAQKGIRAFEAPKPANPVTRGFDPMQTEVWVEAGRLDEARRVAEEELPAFLEESVSNELESDEETAGEDEIDWRSFGWMETHVAVEFLRILEAEAIAGRTEYPLDRPEPVWVVSGARVQVYVDELFVEEAERLLERVEQRLDEQGIAWEEPLCELSGP